MLQIYKKSRAEQKILIFFMPRLSNFATFVAKLRKKVVKNNGFGKINAICPKIMAKRERIQYLNQKVKSDLFTFYFTACLTFEKL